MNQIDGDVLVVGGDDDYGFDDGLDDELLGIDIDSLVATRDTEKERRSTESSRRIGKQPYGYFSSILQRAAWEIIFEYFLVKYLRGRED